MYKPITVMDWVRAFYYLFMYHTGLADPYRNDQFFPKPGFLYDMERDLIAINFGGPDKGKVADNLIIHLNYDVQTLIIWVLKYLEK